MIRWSPVTPTFGAHVHGMDLTAPIDPHMAGALRDLWIDRGLLVFRGQSVSHEQQIALCRVFGEIAIHPARENWVDGHPELLDISYHPDKRERTLLFDVDGKELANWQPWHIDGIYGVRVERGGCLRGVQVPHEGADTGFLCRVQLYDLMPEGLRRRAEGRRVVYQLNSIAAEDRYLPASNARAIAVPESNRRLQARVATDFPEVSHPAFFRHPESGRMTFNVTPLHARRMEDMDDGEGHALLTDLVHHAWTAGDRYYHRWQVDDIVLWDNWRFLHSAEGTPTDVHRQLYRCGLKGDYGFGRLAHVP